MNVTCGNCDWNGPVEKIKPLCNVYNLSARLEPGQDTPAGECLNCGAFCYEDTDLDELNVTIKNVRLTAKGFQVDGNRLVPWDALDAVLEHLPAVAHEKLKWFSIMGPPSDCEAARHEAKRIVEALFPPKPPSSGKVVV